MCVTNRILYVIGLRAKTEHPPIKLFRNTATLPDFTIFSVDLGRNLESNQKLKAQLNSQGYFKFEINLLGLVEFHAIWAIFIENNGSILLSFRIVNHRNAEYLKDPSEHTGWKKWNLMKIP